MSIPRSEVRGSALWRLSKKFDFAAERIIPDPLVFCLIFTVLIFVGGAVFTDNSPISMAQFWYQGVWSQAAFAFQMAFMVVCCAVTARAPQVSLCLDRLADAVKRPAAAILMLMVFGYLSSFLNWAFGLIVTPVLAMALSQRIRGIHFPMLIAAGYSTMVLGQCLSPTATIYALMAGNHSLVDKIGVLPQTITTYNTANIILWVILAAMTTLMAMWTRPSMSEVVEFKKELAPEQDLVSSDSEDFEGSIAQRLNSSRWLMWSIGLLGLMIIAYTIYQKGLFSSLSLSFVIFIFLIANFFLYNTPARFITAYRDNLKLATDVMIQFPFYGGIASMMASSGLATLVVGFFTSIATAGSLPFFTYLSSSLVNLFIPSQGGQWIVQGEIIIDAALQTGANVPLIINSFVLGDEATNLLQPLYVIPALAVVGMRLRDVWGYMAFLWCAWFVVTSIAMFIIPTLL